MAKKNIFGAIWNVWFVHRIANGHCREIKLCPYCPRQIFFSYMFGGARRATEKYGQSGSDICQLVAGKVIKMLIFDEIGHFLGTKFQFALSKYSKKIYLNINFFQKFCNIIVAKLKTILSLIEKPLLPLHSAHLIYLKTLIKPSRYD